MLAPKPLTSESFAPFGDVIDIKTAKAIEINYGLTTRFHNMANIDVNDNGGKAGFSIFRAKPVPLPHKVEIMEYHPLGSQLFYPLCETPFLILVAPASEKLDITKLELFISNGKQGVNYQKGTWHHFLIALDKASDFVVIDRIANDENCIESKLDHKIIIENTPPF